MQKAMETRKGAGNVLAELNAISIRFADFANPVYLLQNVAADKTTRDAAQKCLEKLLPFESEVYQSEVLYQRVMALKPISDTARASGCAKLRLAKEVAATSAEAVISALADAEVCSVIQ